MSTSKRTLVPQVANSDTAGDTNEPRRLAVLKGCDVGREQWQIADIQTGLQEADNGDFASAEEVRAVFAKYGH